MAFITTDIRKIRSITIIL